MGFSFRKTPPEKLSGVARIAALQANPRLTCCWAQPLGENPCQVLTESSVGLCDRHRTALMGDAREAVETLNSLDQCSRLGGPLA